MNKEELMEKNQEEVNGGFAFPGTKETDPEYLRDVPNDNKTPGGANGTW